MIDGLAAMGRVLRPVVEDGYRVQLQLIPWSYTIVYWLLEHVLPIRWLARRLLCAVRIAPARAHDHRARPRRRRLDLPRGHRRARAAAPPRRDLGPDGRHDHRPDRPVLLGAAGDRHAPRDVRRVDAVGRADRRRGQRAARAPADLRGVPAAALPDRGAPALGLPEDGRMVRRLRRRLGRRRRRGRGPRVRAHTRGRRASSAWPAATSSWKASSARAFADEPRVHVYGFTDKMPELLAAADVLVHSTGGVTCLEAMAAGHAGRLLRAAGRPRAPEHARDGDARPAAPGQRHRRAARARTRRASPSGREGDGRRRAAGAQEPGRRRRSCCRRRVGCARSRAGGCGPSRWPRRSRSCSGPRDLDDVDRRGRRRSRRRCSACTRWRTSRPTSTPSALIVRAPSGRITTLASELAASGIHVSFADDAGVPSRAAHRRAARARRRAAARSPGVLAAALGEDARRACTRRRARWDCTTASTTCSRAAGCPSASSCSRAPPAPRRSRGRCG